MSDHPMTTPKQFPKPADDVAAMVADLVAAKDSYQQWQGATTRDDGPSGAARCLHLFRKVDEAAAMLTRQSERIKELEAKWDAARKNERHAQDYAAEKSNQYMSERKRCDRAESLLAETVKVLEQIAAPAIFFLSKKDALFMRNAARDFLAKLNGENDDK